MTDLLCVLQTHSESNNQIGKERYCGAPKREVMRRCVASFIDSLNYVSSYSNLKNEFTVRLHIFDDHSSDYALEKLNDSLKGARFEWELNHLPIRGIMPSILSCYSDGFENGKDVVYFVQDDYLYYQTAVYEMLWALHDFMHLTGTGVGVVPFNDPYWYIPENSKLKHHILQGRSRWWRTTIHTPSCMMIPYSVLNKNWDLFYKMATSKISGTMEMDSINKLWYERNYVAVAPIPSLALHMQYETEKDPFIFWQTLWAQYA